MKNKVIFISPHPDDETLGCGGTILKHKTSKDKIYWVIMTNIDESHGWSEKRVEERQREIDKVSEIYGFNSVFKLNFPTTALDTIPFKEIIIALSKVIDVVKPNIVYLPNRSDIHTDHQITFKVAMSCIKNFRVPFIKRILMYECLSETEFSPALQENIFNPNVYVDITDYFEKKIAIMKIYKSEIMKAPYPRSINTIESLAKYRGSRIGKKYAEAFMLLYEEIL